jgi:hypothetical protein
MCSAPRTMKPRNETVNPGSAQGRLEPIGRAIPLLEATASSKMAKPNIEPGPGLRGRSHLRKSLRYKMDVSGLERGKGYTGQLNHIGDRNGLTLGGCHEGSGTMDIHIRHNDVSAEILIGDDVVV